MVGVIINYVLLTTMIERVRARIALILLTTLTALAMTATMAALLTSYFKKQVGFLTSNSSSFVCSTYLSLKLQQNKVVVLDTVAIVSVISLLSDLIVLIILVYLLVKWCKCQEQLMMQFTLRLHAILYIGVSVATLGIAVAVAYYLTYITEEGVNCSGSVYGDWVMLVSLFGLALIALLISWVYLVFCLQIQDLDESQSGSVFESELRVVQNKQQKQLKSCKESLEGDKNSRIDEQKQIKSCKESLEGDKSSRIDETLPQNAQLGQMTALYEQIQNNIVQNDKEDKISLKQPLLEQIDSDDKEDEVPGDLDGKKIVYITYDDYVRKEMRKQSKEKEKQDLVDNILRQAQEKKEKEKEEEEKEIQKQETIRKLSQSAIPPDHPDFHKIFAQSDDQNKIVPNTKTPKLRKEASFEEEEYFPANFVPSDQNQAKRFQAYKKRLLKRYRQSRGIIKSTFRHPQNIDGGRSKRSIRKFIMQNKRPSRNQETYRSGIGEQLISVNISQLTSSSEEDQQSIASGRFGPSKMFPHQERDELVEGGSEVVAKVERSEDDPGVLFFSKQKVKQRRRKPLFNNGHNMTMNQILHSKLQEQAQIRQRRDSKLKELRQRRKINYSKGNRKGTKLIQFVRSKYQ